MLKNKNTQQIEWLDKCLRDPKRVSAKHSAKLMKNQTYRIGRFCLKISDLHKLIWVQFFHQKHYFLYHQTIWVQSQKKWFTCAILSAILWFDKWHCFAKKSFCHEDFPMVIWVKFMHQTTHKVSFWHGDWLYDNLSAILHQSTSVLVNCKIWVQRFYDIALKNVCVQSIKSNFECNFAGLAELWAVLIFFWVQI
jgi:hypothetical protein